jgi:hypothetical protein
MSEEKKSKFRIKWADREVEYYGDEAKAAYDDLIAHVKSVPIQGMIVTPPQAPTTTPPSSQPPATENRELALISRDSGIPIEQLGQLLQFRKVDGFSELVPFLPRRLEEDADATLVVVYALQVGLQKHQLEVLYVKRVMSEVNGYQLPSNRFGEILKNFRSSNWTITAQTGGRYRPFSLSADGGLEAARGVLRRLLQ